LLIFKSDLDNLFLDGHDIHKNGDCTMKKNIFRVLIILLLIGTASAAVYEITAPQDAKLWFTREVPQSNEMITLIEIGEGFGNRCDYGEMESNVLNRKIIHMNEANITFEGCVYFQLNCTTGMNDIAGGIEDFVSIAYTCPNGTVYPCGGHIDRVSPTSIKITPPMEPYNFSPDMTEVFSEIEIVFVDGAYGDYELTVWTE